MTLAVSRRGFIAGLCALVGGLVLDEGTGLFVPKRKIWVVGADLVSDQAATIVSNYLRDPESRAKLAMSMIMPLRSRLDYQRLARSLVQVQQLPDGALTYFDDQPFRFDHSMSKA